MPLIHRLIVSCSRIIRGCGTIKDGVDYAAVRPDAALLREFRDFQANFLAFFAQRFEPGGQLRDAVEVNVVRHGRGQCNWYSQLANWRVAAQEFLTALNGERELLFDPAGPRPSRTRYTRLPPRRSEFHKDHGRYQGRERRGARAYADEVRPVRLTHKFADVIDGVDVSAYEVGDRLALPVRAATLLVAEGWAAAVEASDMRGSDRDRRD
jgi:hypothetical protein